jgi:hypothetical protein
MNEDREQLQLDIAAAWNRGDLETHARLLAQLKEPCCEGRPAGHTGKCWPLGATHPAS